MNAELPCADENIMIKMAMVSINRLLAYACGLCQFLAKWNEGNSAYGKSDSTFLIVPI